MDGKKIEKADEVLELGQWLGQRQAFSLVAGRCSAADARALRELRESKKYKLLGLNWEEACKQLIGICRSAADQIIRHEQEFGSDYFVIAQVTGISADEYRRIQGSVSAHKLLCAGEEIAISIENAPKLAAAVDALRSETPAAPPAASPQHRFDKAERGLRKALAEVDELRAAPLDIGERMRLKTAIGEAIRKLQLMDLQVRV